MDEQFKTPKPDKMGCFEVERRLKWTKLKQKLSQEGSRARAKCPAPVTAYQLGDVRQVVNLLKSKALHVTGATLSKVSTICLAPRQLSNVGTQLFVILSGLTLWWYSSTVWTTSVGTTAEMYRILTTYGGL
jgi:hypothetical protein